MGLRFAQISETRHQRLRLVKVGAHTRVVIDAPANGGEGREYDPWAPQESWAAIVTWLPGDRLQIDVPEGATNDGPYRLVAERAPQGSSPYWRGLEASPRGESLVEVAVLSDRLTDFGAFLGRDYLMFTAGVFTPSRGWMAGSPEHLSPRPRGVAQLLVPHSLGSVDSRGGDVCTCQGLHGGETYDIRIRSHPTQDAWDAPVEFDIDYGEQLYRWNWNYGDLLHPDSELGCFRSAERLMFQVASV